MGRVPTRNKNLPRGMRARHRGGKIYYFLDTGAKPRKEVALGSDYVLAVQKWAELTSMEKPRDAVATFRHAAERYQREEIPKKGLETQKDNLRELANLYVFFDEPPVPLDKIEPRHIRGYLDWRPTYSAELLEKKNKERAAEGKPPLKSKGKGEVRANREKALFSAIFNFAREKGLTANANPCAGIKGYKEDGRDIYIEDAVYQAVWEVAEPHLCDAMDLAYLTSQRPADVRKMTRADLRDGAVAVKQNKTGAKLRVSVEGELARVIERINARKVLAPTLAAKINGQQLTESMLRGAFDRARVAAIEAHPELAMEIRAFQFRDLRAKAATDTDERDGITAAQEQLGHSTAAMTKHYVRHRKGKLVRPTK